MLDEDGDLIAFSTGEELLEALGFVDNGLFRVFVKPSKYGKHIYIYICNINMNKCFPENLKEEFRKAFYFLY